MTIWTKEKEVDTKALEDRLEQSSRGRLESMVLDALSFDKDHEIRYYTWGSSVHEEYVHSLGRKFTDKVFTRVMDAADKELNTKVTEAVLEVIHGEEFLDKLVERIKAKQL